MLGNDKGYEKQMGHWAKRIGGGNQAAILDREVRVGPH